MYLKDGRVYPVSENIEELFQISSNVELPVEFLSDLSLAISLTRAHQDFGKNRTRKLIVIFSGSTELTLGFNEDEHGTEGSYALFPVEKLILLGQKQRIVCFVEEFVHHFWDEADEIETSRIVSEIVPDLGYNPSNGNYIFLNRM